jgi:hypothetical protein
MRDRCTIHDRMRCSIPNRHAITRFAFVMVQCRKVLCKMKFCCRLGASVNSLAVLGGAAPSSTSNIYGRDLRSSTPGHLAYFPSLSMAACRNRRINHRVAKRLLERLKAGRDNIFRAADLRRIRQVEGLTGERFAESGEDDPTLPARATREGRC